MDTGVFILNNSKDLKSSKLQASYYPPLDISDGSYELCFLGLKTNFKIPNVSEKLKNNKFTYIKDNNPITFKIPDGTYGIIHLKDIFEEIIGSGFVMTPNTNTFKCEIKSIFQIDFSTDNSIGSLLGFHKRKLEANKKHISDDEVDIFKIKSPRIHCPIALGQYINSIRTDVIYTFYIKVKPGYDIVEEPQNYQYYPIIGKDYIDMLTIEIKDEDGNLIDFRDEYIEVKIKIRKIQ